MDGTSQTGFGRTQKDTDMSNTTLTSVNEQAKQAKAQALETLNAIVEPVAEAKDTVAKAEQKVASEAQKSGLAHRLELHFANLGLVEMAGKPSLIILKSKNIPPQAQVICSEGKNGKVVVKILSAMTLHTGDELTEEQENANTVINTLGGAVGKAVEKYVNVTLDICRNWAELYGCATEQKLAAAKKLYESWSKKNGK